MPGPRDVPITYRTLHDGGVVRIREYVCRAGRGGPGAEEEGEGHTIVFTRHGAFCRHVGRRTITTDVNQVAFFSTGTAYRVSHPGDCGDRGTSFAVPARVLRDIVSELDPRLAERPGQIFPALGGPCDAGVFWRHRLLMRRLGARERAASSGSAAEETRRQRAQAPQAPAAPGTAEPFWVEETALQVVADVLGATFASRGRTSPGRRDSTRRGHEDLVEAARACLARGLGERLTLDGVARALHASPFHLARVFRQRTGLTLHRYLTLLRLRGSLERLAQGQRDLAALALELGFSSHSHFTDAFRREFGSAPSQVRRASAWREMSRNLEA